MSQPALSRIIRDIEASQGIQLFERTGRGVRPTHAGEVFADHARTILQELKILSADMERLAGTETGEIKISLPLRVGAIIIVPLLRQFSSTFPSANINVFENLNLTTQQLVASGDVDIGICYAPPTPSGAVVETIGHENLFVVGRADVIGSDGDPMTMQEACRLPMVLPNRQAHYRSFISAAFDQAGHPLRVAREVDSVGGLNAFAAEGEGATILPFSSVARDLEHGHLHVRALTQQKITRRICMITGEQNKSKLASETVTLLREIVSRHRDELRWLDN